MAYLFAHFKEKITPDGEQVYFALSKNGLDWREVNGGKPVITCDKGEKGARDIEIVRLKNSGFVILATDLCIANRYDENYRLDWRKISTHGSNFISLWRSENLVDFSPQTLLPIGDGSFGCIWAPEVFFDDESGEYLLHFSACKKTDGLPHMAIYSCRTTDFETFSNSELFFEKDGDVIDSHIVKIENTYHLFYKNSGGTLMNMHATAESLNGKWRHDAALEEYMATVYRPGSFEAPTTYILPDGRWCLMLDFFGCEKEKMGYVPFVSPKAGNSNFRRADKEFSFPYGFKHGRVLEISDEEYNRIAHIKI